MVGEFETEENSNKIARMLSENLTNEDLYEELIDISSRDNILYHGLEETIGLKTRQLAYLTKLVNEIDKYIEEGLEYVTGAYSEEFDMVLELVPFRLLGEEFIYACIRDNGWNHVVYKYDDIRMKMDIQEFVEIK